MKKKGLILNCSYKNFILGEPIKKYVHIRHSEKKFNSPPPESTVYYFYKDKIHVWCDERGLIDSFQCESSCFYQGYELIGMKFEKFLDILKIKPDQEDSIYMLVNGRGQTNHVYDFFSLGLIIWVWRNKIRSVTIYRSEEK